MAPRLAQGAGLCAARRRPRRHAGWAVRSGRQRGGLTRSVCGLAREMAHGVMRPALWVAGVAPCAASSSVNAYLPIANGAGVVLGQRVGVPPIKSSANAFGMALFAANFNWASICQLDSDGDGKTNRQELREPLHVAQGPARPGRDGHHEPGVADDAPLAQVPTAPPTNHGRTDSAADATYFGADLKPSAAPTTRSPCRARRGLPPGHPLARRHVVRVRGRRHGQPRRHLPPSRQAPTLAHALAHRRQQHVGRDAGHLGRRRRAGRTASRTGRAALAAQGREGRARRQARVRRDLAHAVAGGRAAPLVTAQYLPFGRAP